MFSVCVYLAAARKVQPLWHQLRIQVKFMIEKKLKKSKNSKNCVAVFYLSIALWACHVNYVQIICKFSQSNALKQHVCDHWHKIAQQAWIIAQTYVRDFPTAYAKF